MRGYSLVGIASLFAAIVLGQGQGTDPPDQSQGADPPEPYLYYPPYPPDSQTDKPLNSSIAPGPQSSSICTKYDSCVQAGAHLRTILGGVPADVNDANCTITARKAMRAFLHDHLTSTLDGSLCYELTENHTENSGLCPFVSYVCSLSNATGCGAGALFTLANFMGVQQCGIDVINYNFEGGIAELNLDRVEAKGPGKKFSMEELHSNMGEVLEQRWLQGDRPGFRGAYFKMAMMATHMVGRKNLCTRHVGTTILELDDISNNRFGSSRQFCNRDEPVDDEPSFNSTCPITGKSGEAGQKWYKHPVNERHAVKFWLGTQSQYMDEDGELQKYKDETDILFKDIMSCIYAVQVVPSVPGYDDVDPNDVGWDLCNVPCKPQFNVSNGCVSFTVDGNFTTCLISQSSGPIMRTMEQRELLLWGLLAAVGVFLFWVLAWQLCRVSTPQQQFMDPQFQTKVAIKGYAPFQDGC